MIPDQAPRADDSEDGIDERNDQRDDAERHVEREADESREHDEQQHEAQDDDAAAQAVSADLLLEGHGAGARATCGTVVSGPRGEELLGVEPERPRDEHPRMLWIAVL